MTRSGSVGSARRRLGSAAVIHDVDAREAWRQLAALGYVEDPPGR